MSRDINCMVYSNNILLNCLPSSNFLKFPVNYLTKFRRLRISRYIPSLYKGYSLLPFRILHSSAGSCVAERQFRKYEENVLLFAPLFFLFSLSSFLQSSARSRCEHPFLDFHRSSSLCFHLQLLIYFQCNAFASSKNLQITREEDTRHQNVKTCYQLCLPYHHAMHELCFFVTDNNKQKTFLFLSKSIHCYRNNSSLIKK